ncbi:DUF6214 family protein [Streptomyces sp. ID05-39B]|uniref:DUF6214 family protein n=1 Tax=Streptomyces sp. ID05-39B TaxID=3028664 RepID=UPI0029AAE29D|nr:DUF6214 family protein [Streptomyces sp. ID05-39B]MDX3529752.1 DUF6214 family protein [Streptomyces sp. ID05-39B]
MSVRPAWEVHQDGEPTSWCTVRLAFPDEACVEVLAVVSAESVSVEDVRSCPALSLDDLSVLAEWIEEPLFEWCGSGRQSPSVTGPDGSDGPAAGIAPGGSGARRARPVRPRGIEGRRLVADEYRAAQEQGADPVLAVMRTTGHSRRRSLSMIAQARDAGFLTPRHARR